MGNFLIDYIPCIIVAIVSIIITCIIAKKYANRFSWFCVIMFAVIVSGYVVFIIPIICPFISIYFINKNAVLDIWYAYLSMSEYGSFIVANMDISVFSTVVKILINVVFLLYDFGLCIVSSYLLKKSGLTIVLLWYFLNAFVILLLPIVSIIVILLLPPFIIYGCIVGFYTGIKNYILSMHTVRINK